MAQNEKGQVIGFKNKRLVVKMERTEACAKCRACIAGMSKKDMILEAENRCGANIDDWVELVLENNGFMQAVLIMYGIPFIAFVAGMFISYFMFNLGDIISFFVGVICIGISFFWIKSQEKRWESRKYLPIAVKITEK